MCCECIYVVILLTGMKNSYITINWAVTINLQKYHKIQNALPQQLITTITFKNEERKEEEKKYGREVRFDSKTYHIWIIIKF